MFFISTLVALLYESFLAIPFVGGATVIASGYGTITAALIIHAIVLIVRFATDRPKFVPTFAIVLTLFTWIPLLGWVCHVIIAVLYLFDLLMNRPRTYRY